MWNQNTTNANEREQMTAFPLQATVDRLSGHPQLRSSKVFVSAKLKQNTIASTVSWEPATADHLLCDDHHAAVSTLT